MPVNPQDIAGLLVVKSERKMYLIDKNDNIIRSYKVSLGPSPLGNKEAEGDGKTPEGRYTINFKNEKSEFYKSLKISYPSQSDINRARQKGVKPGSNIFIHGQPNERSWMFWRYNSLRDWTHGCIAVSNKEIDELWQMVSSGTPVVIEP